MRTFFALELGDDARQAACAVARALRAHAGGDGVRWVRGESLHVTLRFLGEIAPARIPALVREVGARTAAAAPFALALGAVRLFPSPRRPRVVALGLTPEAPVAALARAVEAGCVAAGFARETRPFRAHLTLGRAREGVAPSPDGVEPPPPAPFPVREIVLFESRLGAGGSLYRPLERLPLGGLDHPQQTSLED